MLIFVCQRGERTQELACADLLDAETMDWLAPRCDSCDVVYSDPPWNPGNEKYWRRHAGVEPPRSYRKFLDAWCAVVKSCDHAAHVLCEQSDNDAHRQMFLDSVERSGWTLPMLEDWTVFYGSAGARSCRRPNRLLHFGNKQLTTDPSGMFGEPMTIRACSGLGLSRGSRVLDHCVGKGMTSRMAHYFDWDFVGIELNSKRLNFTVEWLRKQGYAIHERQE